MCERFCGTKIEIHHIDDNSDNSESNAIAVCFDCHAEIGHYNSKHPKGKKYSPNELRLLKAKTIQKHSTELTSISGHGSTDYGRGFRDGYDISAKKMFSQIMWRIIGRYGDFAIEVLTIFDASDSASIMGDRHLDDSVDTGHFLKQSEGHIKAWEVGQLFEFWDVDGDEEKMFITHRGKEFRDFVRNHSELSKRYETLKQFWETSYVQGCLRKPGIRPLEKEIYPGYVGYLQMWLYQPAKLNDNPDVFVIETVNPDVVELSNIEREQIIFFDPNALEKLDIDRETAILTIKLPITAIKYE